MGLIELAVWAQVGPGGYPGRSGGGDATAALAGVCCQFLFMLVFMIPTLAGIWKAFDKAGEPGWAAIVPVYNMMVMSKIAGRGEVYGLLTLIPCAGIIFAIIIHIDFCKQFDVSGGFAAGLILVPFVFWPMLGFGSARYLGAGGRPRRRVYDEEEEEEERPRRRRRDDDDEDEGDDRIRRRRRPDDY